MEKLVKFRSEGQVIFGNLGLPYRGACGVIMSHGMESSKDGNKWRALAPRLYQAGFAYLSFTYRGCGQGEEKSEGEFEDTTLSARIKDYRAAIDFLGTTGADVSRLGVVGSSFGGMVALAARSSRIKAIVALATPARLGRREGEQPGVPQDSEYFELASGRRLRAGFFADIRQYDLCRSVAGIGCPLLVVHGSADEVVPVSDAHELYQSASEPKRLVIIEGGDHAFNDLRHLEQVMGLTLDWFEQYIK